MNYQQVLTRYTIFINMRVMIGPDVKKARKQLRLKQTEFAAICSIRPETLSRIEHGGEVPGYMDMIAFLLLRDEAAVKQAMERRGIGDYDQC